MPVRYAHRPAITATRSRNAISRFRLPGFLRTRNDSLRRWLALLSQLFHYITAAKAARVAFPPRSKETGLPSSRTFCVSPPISSMPAIYIKSLTQPHHLYISFNEGLLGNFPEKRLCRCGFYPFVWEICSKSDRLDTTWMSSPHLNLKHRQHRSVA